MMNQTTYYNANKMKFRPFVNLKNFTKLLIIYFCFVYSGSTYAQKDLVNFVNTLQGTNSGFDLTHGNTYPTLALPWGMNFWTAQTGVNRDGWIYQYKKDSIRGFRQTHQCSSWTRDYAAFSLMPVSGTLVVDQFKRALKFSHENETAKPNYYKVTFENKITTEMSPTERGVYFRFSFPKGKDTYIVLDGNSGGSMVKIFPEQRKIIGYCKNANNSAPKGFVNYFVAYFNKPFIAYGTWKNAAGEISSGNTEAEDKYVGGYIQFSQGVAVEARVSSSFISPEQAERNLQQEFSGFSRLEDAKDAAAKAWNKQLGKIEVEGGTPEEKATFYSCFFRSMLFPRQFYEYNADKQPIYYSTWDGKIHNGYMFTDTGFWVRSKPELVPCNVFTKFTRSFWA